MPRQSENAEQKLQLILRHLSGDLNSVEEELAATRALRANGGDDDEHDPDGIPLSAVLQQLQGQRVRLLGESREAQNSLVALAQGRYGTCEKCSRSIDPGRLEIRPTARTCVTCAR